MQCKFILKSGCKILNDGHFKILGKECTGCDEGIDPERFVSSLISKLLFNTFNIYKNTISKMLLVFFLT